MNVPQDVFYIFYHIAIFYSIFNETPILETTHASNFYKSSGIKPETTGCEEKKIILYRIYLKLLDKISIETETLSKCNTTPTAPHTHSAKNFHSSLASHICTAFEEEMVAQIVIYYHYSCLFVVLVLCFSSNDSFFKF